ncbi:MAG: TonB-dependent receptor [Bacteroidia bacterium]
MKYTMYIMLLASLAMSMVNPLAAQQPTATISGTVVDSASQQPIEFATIVLNDSQTQASLGGVTTTANGLFSIKTPSKNVYLEINFIGFETKKITNIEIKDGKANIGKIELVETVAALDEVVIETDKSTTEFRLDRRVFNVGQDLSSTGASALEVLNNVPSVNVSIEGEVSLRGSQGVQILINGKPSVLASEEGNALGSITADMIERVEVITNPSAKYEAEGTAGIINIVLKKDERKGLNGSVSLNTGDPDNHSVGLSLNRRSEKFNLFSQLGAGYRSLPRINNNINDNKLQGVRIESDGLEFRNETFFNLVLGTDYYINKRNVLTLSGNFAYEIEDQPSKTAFSQINEGEGLVTSWDRSEVTEANNPKYRYELNYKREFKDNKEHTLLFSALGNLFRKTQSSDFQDVGTFGNFEDRFQRTATDFGEVKYTFQLDYTRPFSDKVTLESGGQYVIQNVSNDFAVSNLIGDEWVNDPGLTNVFGYDQKVLGIYSTGAYEGARWGLKAGVRVENTILETELETLNETNRQNYTNLFPSVHTSYKANDFLSFQAGYSRRIYRPRLWDLNPFFNIRNNFSIRAGNPELLPEFTDSYEVNGIYILKKFSLNMGIYWRNTTDVIERVSIFKDNVNTTTPRNIGTNRSTGIEFNGKYSAAKWLTMRGDFNFNFFNREGTFEGTSFDFAANQWSSKFNTRFKLPLDIDMEATANYRSRIQTVQGIMSANLFADFGIRKKLLKGKAVLSASVRDIFASRFRESNIDQEDFYLYSFSQRGRFITFGFSFGFGKGEAMEYSGAKRR